MEKIVIAIDTMGTDNGSAYFVQGIAEAMDLYDDLSFIVTGKEEELKTYIDQYGCDKTRIEVVDATEEITCHDAPVDAIRRKKNSSMVLALNLVRCWLADSFWLDVQRGLSEPHWLHSFHIGTARRY